MTTDTTAARTDTPALLGLCQAALKAQAEQLQEIEYQSVRECLADAAKWAESTFGTEAAALMGDWTLNNTLPVDYWGAFVELAPGTTLQFTAHVEDGHGFALHTVCGSCGETRLAEVNGLESLGEALRRAGVR